MRRKSPAVAMSMALPTKLIAAAPSLPVAVPACADRPTPAALARVLMESAPSDLMSTPRFGPAAVDPGAPAVGIMPPPAPTVPATKVTSPPFDPIAPFTVMLPVDCNSTLPPPLPYELPHQTTAGCPGEDAYRVGKRRSRRAMLPSGITSI